MNIAIISFCGTLTEAYYITHLSDALSKTSRVTVFIPEHGRLQTLGESVGLVKFSFPSSLPKAILLASVPFTHRGLLREIKLINPDVIHIAFELRAPFLFALALHRHYPIVTTIHEPKSPLHTVVRSVLLNPIHSANVRFLIKSSDRIIVHGEKHKEYLTAKKVPAYKIAVTPHGAFSHFALSAKENLGAQEGNILFFGRITPYKGIEYLIQAVKLIEKRLSTVTATIAGEGDFAKYERLIEGDEHFIVDNRLIPDDEVASLFQKACVVVLPYTDGSQSGIISIAGGFKKPVVATDVGNFSEMIEDGKTGFIVPPRDASALAEAIIRLLRDDKLRQQMGENAYQTVKEKLSWDNIAQRTLRVYEEAMILRCANAGTA